MSHSTEHAQPQQQNLSSQDSMYVRGEARAYRARRAERVALLLSLLDSEAAAHIAVGPDTTAALASYLSEDLEWLLDDARRTQ